MLSLSGNSETAFAGLNSIIINPVIYAEWNYNSIQKPYVVSTASTGPLYSSALSSPASWTPTNNASVYTDTLSGYISDSDPSASAIGFYIPSTRATFTSNTVTVPLNNNSYYKLVFYIKADQAVTYPNLSNINSSGISASTNIPGTTNAYYYRVSPVSANGRSSFSDLGGGDIFSGSTGSPTASVILNFNVKTYNAPAYNVYRGTTPSFLPYIGTFPLRSIKVKGFNNLSSTTSATFLIENITQIREGERFAFYTSSQNRQANLWPKNANTLNHSYWVVNSINSSSINATLTSDSSGIKQTSFVTKSYKGFESNIHFNGFTDSLSRAATATHAPALASTKIRVMPSVALYNSGVILETPKQYLKYYENDITEPDTLKTMIEIDGVTYKKVILFFGSSEKFNSFKLDIDVDSPYGGAQVLLYRPEIYQIDEWTYSTNNYFPIESPFQPFKPGEALLHPYLLTSVDGIVNKDITASISKPASFATLNPDKLFGTIYPYKQMYNSNLSGNMKYYISSSITPTSNFSIRAQYNNYLNVNKIVLKGVNVYSDLTQTSGSVILYTPTSSVIVPFSPALGTFNNSGILTLYYNGQSWKNSRFYDATYPAKLTDSGILQNVISNVTGIGLNITNVQPTSSAVIGVDLPNRMHLLEISPRLEIDISNYTQEITINKSLDNTESAAGFPVGYINANSGILTLNNVPVYKNNFAHTIFEAFSDKSTFSNLLRQNTKLTGFLRSPNNDFTDFIPLMTMYTDEWNVSGTDQITLDLFDGAQNQLMTLQPADYLGEYESMFSTITNLLDTCGFSDYDYDGLKQIMKNKNVKTSHFWTDKKMMTVLDALKSLFVAHQIGATFDEYGILRFTDLDKIINSYNDKTLNPNFAVTDIPLRITNSENSDILYIPNIIRDSYTETASRRIGKISLNYQIPERAFTDDLNPNGQALKSSQPQSAWESQQAAVIKSFADKSVLSSDKSFYQNPDRTMLKTSKSTPRYTLGYGRGTAFLQGELIAWSGIEYKFTPLIGQDISAVYPSYANGINAMISSAQDIDNMVQELSNLDDTITQVTYQFTGNVLGLLRGQRGTTTRNHLLFDDTSPTSGYKNSYGYFRKGIITSSVSVTTLSGGGQTSNIVFEKNVAKITVKRQKSGRTHPVYLSPIKAIGVGDYHTPVAASSFNYFTTLFQAPNYAKPDSKNQKINTRHGEFGFYIDTSYGKLMFNLRNEDQKTYLAPAFDTKDSDNYCLYSLKAIKEKFVPTVTGINQIASTGSVVKQVQVKNIFDGVAHRFSILFSNDPNTNNTSQPDSNNRMSYSYVTFFIDNSKYGPYAISQKSGKTNALPKSEWGVYAKNIAVNQSRKTFTENPQIFNVFDMYASRLDANLGHEIEGLRVKFHWETSSFITKLVNEDSNAEPPYFFWGPNYLTGIKFYDQEDYHTSPMIPKNLQIYYAGYNPNSDVGPYPTLYATTPKSIGYSHLYSTPFRSKFAIVNRDAQIVFLATSTGQVDKGELTPLSITGYYNKMSDPIVLERIIDSTAISNSIVMNTQWIQSSQDADKLMEKLYLMTNIFNSEINVTIFGNPLIQLGDFCQFVYSVKKIGYDPEDTTGSNQRKIFFVKSVSHSYNEGLNTNLVLKPMFLQSQ